MPAACLAPPRDRRALAGSPRGSRAPRHRRQLQAGGRRQLPGPPAPTSSLRRWLASGARTRCSIERGSLEVIFPVRTPRGDVGAPFLACFTSFVRASCARPTRHRFLLLGDQCRPRAALEPTTGQLRLIGTVNLCRAGSPQPSYSRPDPCHSIDFTPPRFRFRQSLVARRRSARAYRRPRARPRRGEGVQDMQLDGTVASRRIWRSSRSPVPVPVAHCAPLMQCRSTPPALVPRPHRG